jgi:hypothetical protein
LEFVSLVPGDGEKERAEWKVWMLRTILEGVAGWGDVDSMVPCAELTSTNGYVNGINGDEKSFDVVVVGAGQAGLSTAGRLKALGVGYVVLERHESMGDNWGSRYDSAKCEFSSY